MRVKERNLKLVCNLYKQKEFGKNKAQNNAILFNNKE